MKRFVSLVTMSLLGALLFVGLLPGTAAAPPPPPPIIIPGKDSQVFRPESPGYLIKKNRDQVLEYRQVPPPTAETGEPEKQQDDRAKEKEGSQK
jgi:hypothetical protein